MRKALSWIAVSLGLIVGMLGFALLSNGIVPNTDSAEEWREVVVGLVCLYAWIFLLVVGSLAARRSRNLGAMLLLIASALNLAAPTLGGHPSHALIAIPPLVFGLFWWITARLGWDPLIATPPSWQWKRLALPMVIAIPILYCVPVLSFTAWRANLFSGNCTKALNLKQGPEGFTFMAKVVYSGFYETSDGDWKGVWAIATVEEQLLHSDRSVPRFVMLINNVFQKGELYLVQGQRRQYTLPRPVTVIDAGPCTCTFPVSQAKAQLSILRKLGPNSLPSGLRILGSIRTSSDEPVAGIQVRVQSALEKQLLVTDREGIYITAALAPGDYTVEPLNLRGTHEPVQWPVSEKELTERGIMVLAFRTDP